MTPNEETQVQANAPDDEDNKAPGQMCCDGERTASEHRHESSDGKCCSD